VTATRMPALYVSHGAPPLADDPIWPGELAAWSRDLPRPKAILMISAHWEDAPLAIGATSTVPLYYDFYGFPSKYYEVIYPAPGAPALAAQVRALLRNTDTPVQDVPDRGLDHGAYVPLVEMYPGADIPVLQISMPTLDPQRLMDVGRTLAPLREEGVLIVGSGFFTHNLRAIQLDGQRAELHGRVRPLGTGSSGRRRRRRAARLRACRAFRSARPSAQRALRTAFRRPRRGWGRPQ
jgi:4,5-DOPA dioxygenase extradiol